MAIHATLHGSVSTSFVNQDVLFTDEDIQLSPAGMIVLRPGTFVYLGSTTNALKVHSDGNIELIGSAKIKSDLTFESGAPRTIRITDNNLTLETLANGDIILRAASKLDFTSSVTKNLRVESLVSDPVGLAVSDVGRIWFNTTTGKLMVWDGTTVVTIGP